MPTPPKRPAKSTRTPAGKPQTGGKPKPTGKAVPSDKPKPTGKPVASDKPKSTGKPVASDKPKPSGKPVASDKSKPSGKQVGDKPKFGKAPASGKAPTRGHAPSHATAQQVRPSRKDDVAVDITGMVFGGFGMALQGGHPLYIPYTIEGEKISARLTHIENGAQFAEGVSFLKASQDRVYPECGHFGKDKCWGCQWQHIDYRAQLLMKFDLIAQTLQDRGKFSDDILERVLQPVIPSPQTWRYNHQATFYRAKAGQYGFPRQERGGYETIVDCLTLHPDLQALYESLDIDFEDLPSFSLYLGTDGGTMLLLHSKNETMPELTADMATSVNVLLPDREPINLFGDSFVRYQVRERWFRVTAGAYFRANVAQIEALVSEVVFALNLKGHEHVLDLYAGVGVFSAFIAPLVEVVTLVESYPPAVTDADENLADFDNVDVVEGTVSEILEDMLETEAHYDVVVIDPLPRGMSDEDMALLLKMAIPRVVYVSGNVQAFASDALKLTQAGYRLERVQPLDAAPHTYYTDLVGIFQKPLEAVNP